MAGYDRTYETGRMVTKWIERVSWLAVVFGGLLAMFGVATLFSSESSYDMAMVVTGKFSLVSGLLMIAGGLVSIMGAQATSAILNTAEMTAEMLAIARGQNNPAQTPTPQSPKSSSSGSVEPKQPKEWSKVLKGRKIVKIADGVSVDGRVFKNVSEAAEYFNSQQSE